MEITKISYVQFLLLTDEWWVTTLQNIFFCHNFISIHKRLFPATVTLSNHEYIEHTLKRKKENLPVEANLSFIGWGRWHDFPYEAVAGIYPDWYQLQNLFIKGI